MISTNWKCFKVIYSYMPDGNIKSIWISISCFFIMMQETYRYSDPFYISKISAESICILPFINIINFLIQNPESNASPRTYYEHPTLQWERKCFITVLIKFKLKGNEATFPFVYKCVQMIQSNTTYYFKIRFIKTSKCWPWTWISGVQAW